MSDWASYRLGDFLMFTPRTYARLFEQYNRDLWPLHVVAIAIGLVILILARREKPRVVAALLAVVWLWVAWAFFFERYSNIHTFANWFAAAFALEAVLLIAYFRKPIFKLPLLFFAIVLIVYPLLSARREVFGMVPDPTALGTIPIVLMQPGRARWLLLPIPFLWCAFSAVTLLAMAAR